MLELVYDRLSFRLVASTGHKVELRVEALRQLLKRLILTILLVFDAMDERVTVVEIDDSLLLNVFTLVDHVEKTLKLVLQNQVLLLTLVGDDLELLHSLLFHQDYLVLGLLRLVNRVQNATSASLTLVKPSQQGAKLGLQVCKVSQEITTAFALFR